MESIEEIEGSQMGEALAADSKASPYSVTKLRDIISDIISYCVLGYEGNVCRLFDNNAEESE